MWGVAERLGVSWTKGHRKGGCVNQRSGRKERCSRVRRVLRVELVSLKWAILL